MAQTGKIVAMALVAFLAGSVAYFCVNYDRHDHETKVLTDDVRRHASGSFLLLSDGFTHYEMAGPVDGRTVVLVHGFSVPYFLWDQTFTPLVRAGFRVIRYDLYGRGLSDRPDVPYDADLYDRQLIDLLAALHVAQPVDMVGLSMGGPITVGFTARHPDKVRTLSLIDPAYLSGTRPPWPLRTGIVGEYLMCVELIPRIADGQKEDFVHPERYPDYFLRYREQMRYKGFRRALLSTLRDYLSIDDREDFRKVGQTHKPVELFWGKADQDVPFEVSKDVLREIPQAEFHPIEDAAHVPQYEHPEIVNPALVDFLHKN